MSAKINTLISSLGLAGFTGWLLSYLVVLPVIPGEAAQTSPDAEAG